MIFIVATALAIATILTIVKVLSSNHDHKDNQ